MVQGNRRGVPYLVTFRCKGCDEVKHEEVKAEDLCDCAIKRPRHVKLFCEVVTKRKRMDECEKSISCLKADNS